MQEATAPAMIEPSRVESEQVQDPVEEVTVPRKGCCHWTEFNGNVTAQGYNLVGHFDSQNNCLSFVYLLN